MTNGRKGGKLHDGGTAKPPGSVVRHRRWLHQFVSAFQWGGGLSQLDNERRQQVYSEAVYERISSEFLLAVSSVLTL